MGQISCRAPVVDDISGLVDLDRRALGGLWSADGYRRELDSPNSCLRILTQSGGGMMGLGCYWAILDEAHLTLLGIDPHYQRRGLGQWLLVHLLVDACDRGLTRATLEVRASNSRALALYHSFGFETLGSRRRYYPDGEDALILWQNALKTSEFRACLRQRHQAAAARLTAQGWQITAEKHPANRT
jgi:ribosomal-protein-alanine N-acetyltransferase